MRIMTEKYARIVCKIANERGISVLDMQSEFDGYMRYRPGQSISWDRVHPGAIGALILARAILRELGIG